MSAGHSSRPPFAGVVAIDGPSGAGKSTVARLLAKELGARYLDTGAMYRAVTWAVLRAGVSPDDADAVSAVAARVQLEVSTDADSSGIAVDGHPVDEEIRGPAVTAAVSAVSSVPAVRHRLVRLQRELIGAGGIVVEGRDIGTVVAPKAGVKVFLTASPDARADRRSAEHGATAPDERAAMAAALERRDTLDSSRAVSPFQPAADAVVLDTTFLPVAEVVARLRALADAAVAGGPTPGR